jgi:hypothetical protein
MTHSEAAYRAAKAAWKAAQAEAEQYQPPSPLWPPYAPVVSAGSSERADGLCADTQQRPMHAASRGRAHETA